MHYGYEYNNMADVTSTILNKENKLIYFLPIFIEFIKTLCNTLKNI